MKTTKVGDRVAYKRSNNAKSKWQRGIVEESRPKGSGFTLTIRLDSPKNSKKKGRRELLHPNAAWRLLVFPPKHELPVEVREWCEASNGLVRVIRNVMGAPNYNFVMAKAPYHPVMVVQHVTIAANLEFWPACCGNNEQWDNDEFEDTDFDTEVKFETGFCLRWPHDFIPTQCPD